jgi:hypothetical protein
MGGEEGVGVGKPRDEPGWEVLDASDGDLA